MRVWARSRACERGHRMSARIAADLSTHRCRSIESARPSMSKLDANRSRCTLDVTMTTDQVLISLNGCISSWSHRACT
eukprot:6185544-Pleurochrysis_carterae.AAC.1